MAKEYNIDKTGFPLFNAKVSKNYLLDNNDIRVSEAWSFLSYTIRVAKKADGHVLKMAEQHFLLDLLEQAQYFYVTAQNAPIKSQPLLYYYSFMNLAKIAINLSNYLGNGQRYVHGISDNITPTSKLSNAVIDSWQSKPNQYSISEYLVKALDDRALSYSPCRGRGHSCAIKVIDLMRDCVGIHKAYCEIYNKKGIFYRLDEERLYSSNKKLYYRAEVLDIDDIIMGSLVARGYPITKEVDKYVLLFQTSVRTTANPTLAEKHTLSKKIRDVGLWSVFDGDRYRLYISDKAGFMSSASIIYHGLFFFGSITRYHPDMFDDILSAKEYWLVGEFLKTQPLQFLYMLISKINGAEILMNKV